MDTPAPLTLTCSYSPDRGEWYAVVTQGDEVRHPLIGRGVNPESAVAALTHALLGHVQRLEGRVHSAAMAVVNDLHLRILDGAAELQAMAEADAAASRADRSGPSAEFERLTAKRSGLLLAADYLRGMPWPEDIPVADAAARSVGPDGGSTGG